MLRNICLNFDDLLVDEYIDEGFHYVCNNNVPVIRENEEDEGAKRNKLYSRLQI